MLHVKHMWIKILIRLEFHFEQREVSLSPLGPASESLLLWPFNLIGR